MITRQIYNRDLHAALERVLDSRTEVSIQNCLALLRRAGFKHALPAPTTIARLLVNRGWIREGFRLGEGMVYRRPQAERAA